MVGFKPTQDAVPYGPGFLEPFWGISVLAPIARNVADARAMFEELSGERSETPVAENPRIAFAPSLGLDIPFDVEVADSLEQARSRLAERFVVENAAPIWPGGCDVAALMPIQFAGLAMLYGDRWRATPELFDPDIGAQIEQGLALSGSDVARALEASRMTKETLRRFLGGYDFIVSATTPCPAWTVDSLGPAEIGGRPAAPRDHAVLTPQVNHAGLPAISIPCGRTSKGLPIGLQVIGRAGEDLRLLDVAGRIEKILSNQRTRDVCDSS